MAAQDRGWATRYARAVQGRVDRYELHALLGEGGHGAVYRARHALTQQWVALKLVHVGTHSQHTFDRLVREARAVAAIGHTHIVKVHDCGVTPDGVGFIAMELVDGVPLSQLARDQGPLPVARSLDLVLQVLDALEAAHGAGVVHRDIKPSNVLVRALPDGRDFVTLLDFGISKVRNAGGLPTDPGVAMGTPGYMAPEQFFGAKDADGRADVYAAGVILYELLSGRRPFTGRTFERIAHEVTTTPAPPLATIAPHLPFSLCAVVDHALARDVDARLPSARAFTDALRTAAGPASNPVLSRSDAPHAFLPTLATSSPPPASATAPHPPHPVQAPSGSAPPLAGPSRSEGPRPAPAKERSLVAPAAVFGSIVAIGLVVAFLVARGGGAADAAAAATPDPEAPGTSAKKAASEGKKKAPAPPAPADEDEGPSAPEKAPAAPKASAKATPLFAAKGDGVEVLWPKVVGPLADAEIVTVAKRALPKMAACRRTVADTVEIAVHVHPPAGTITLAAPSPDNKGDAAVARCIAAAFKGAAPGWKPGETGIVTLQANLDAK